MLARNKSFRDALLNRQPVLLDAFLERVLVAGESEVGERHYADINGMFSGSLD